MEKYSNAIKWIIFFSVSIEIRRKLADQYCAKCWFLSIFFEEIKTSHKSVEMHVQPWASIRTKNKSIRKSSSPYAKPEGDVECVLLGWCWLQSRVTEMDECVECHNRKQTDNTEVAKSLKCCSKWVRMCSGNTVYASRWLLWSVPTTN